MEGEEVLEGEGEVVVEGEVVEGDSEVVPEGEEEEEEDQEIAEMKRKVKEMQEEADRIEKMQRQAEENNGKFFSSSFFPFFPSSPFLSPSPLSLTPPPPLLLGTPRVKCFF